MAETHPPPPKRHREDDVVSDTDTTKRHRNSYESPQETNQDLLDFLTNLSSDLFLDFGPQTGSDPDNNLTTQPGPDPDSKNPDNKKELTDDEDEKERVIRHLLEASDDELGIPSRVDVGDAGDGGGGGGGCGDFPVGLCDGLWELEDEAANYYTLLQSELFMQ
ncbi:hypothetical protein SSX86_027617 [Deinandra increscens subsp. villosa]|uniref:Uncharacterized protein n=1 Tax=Deinandra increscens subsp. villosa TaxID=3103831 RepID=A0AAP0CCL8_9ASTR